jgi:hypothetical protein
VARGDGKAQVQAVIRIDILPVALTSCMQARPKALQVHHACCSQILRLLIALTQQVP